MNKNKYNAFTIIELLVAMTLLVMMLGLSGMIFNQTIRAHRTAGASIDVSRSMRSISAQLSNDFSGLVKDAPLIIWFEQQWIDKDKDTKQDADEFVYHDQIEFFADSYFETTKQYLGKTLSGGAARIYYGHANTPGKVNYQESRILARKAHVLTSNDGILLNAGYGQIPAISNWPVSTALNYPAFRAEFGRSMVAGSQYTEENQLEFNTISLMQWINTLNDNSNNAANAQTYITYTLNKAFRPQVNLDDDQTLHLLLSQGVLGMQIQMAYTPQDLLNPVINFPSGIRWWPSQDPNGDGDMTDSDFVKNNMTMLGTYFSLAHKVNVFNLPIGYDVDKVGDLCPIGSWSTSGVWFKTGFYPKALKFTFIVRDSNGLFTEGKTFTHIVYLD